MECENELAVGLVIPMCDGFAIVNIVKNLKQVQFQPFDRAIKGRDQSILVCKKKNKKIVALPFEMILVDDDILEKYSRRISGDDEIFTTVPANNMKVIFRLDLTDSIAEEYETVLKIIKADEETFTKNAKGENIEITSEEWKQIDELKKKTKKGA